MTRQLQQLSSRDGLPAVRAALERYRSVACVAILSVVYVMRYVMQFILEIVMIYYIEVPFPANDGGPDVHYHLEDSEMVLTKHMAALRISGRKFDRITKAFREIGRPHVVTGLIDPEDGKTLGTLLMAPRAGDVPGVLTMVCNNCGRREAQLGHPAWHHFGWNTPLCPECFEAGLANVLPWNFGAIVEWLGRRLICDRCGKKSSGGLPQNRAWGWAICGDEGALGRCHACADA